MVGALDLVALTQGKPRVGNPLGEVVAQTLQLAEVEEARLARDRIDPVADLDPSEALGEEAGELTLEMTDLPPQLSASETLVNLNT